MIDITNPRMEDFARAGGLNPLTARDTHRGWDISFDYPAIPVRDFDWSASHPDYDGAPDANDHRFVHARTREGVIEAIDLWIEENE